MLPVKKYPDSKYPPYPESGRDHAVKMAAAQVLKDKRNDICIYCHAEARGEHLIAHLPDCPYGAAIK